MHQRAHIHRTDESEREREQGSVCSHPCPKQKRQEKVGLYLWNPL